MFVLSLKDSEQILVMLMMVDVRSDDVTKIKIEAGIKHLLQVSE